MRKYRSFLSPDDALRDLRKHASQGAEIRWELHTSRTDVDLASRAQGTTRCGCHSLTPRQEQKRHPERGDLRKHHSAETDKWSLRPDAEHDLRKHLSDDSRMDREHKWTLQVPEVHANPKQRCTCPKQPPAAISPASIGGDGGGGGGGAGGSLRVSRQPSRQVSRQASRQPSPEGSRSRSRSHSRSRSASPVPLPQEPLEIPQPQPQPQPEPQPPPAAAQQPQPAQLAEARRAMRTKWAGKAHLSLPAERKEPRWQRSHDEGKSKSLKERPKYSVRRSMSPDPDPRQVIRVESRLVRRLISPEVSLMDAKWAPYEGYSPLPNVGIKKRETKKISDIRWVPYEESETDEPGSVAAQVAQAAQASQQPEIQGLEEPPRTWSPFHNITPTHLPPPAATPMRSEDEEFRWRFLNQVAAFPIYQGAWREESPPPSPPPPALQAPPPELMGTPVWSPQEVVQAGRAAPVPVSPPPSPPPPPQPKRSTLRARVTARRKASRAKSQEQPAGLDLNDRGEQQRRRPQLLRSKALLLEVPHIDASKRSLSEEVRSYNQRSESTKRGLIFRAKSEDAARVPWFADPERQELREYVTTV